MNGVAAIVQLLVDDAAVIALAPADADPPRISGEELAEGVALPAIDVESVSLTPLVLPKAGAARFVRERVAVRGHAPSTPVLHSLMKAIRNACADKSPGVTGITNVHVTLDGAGPQGISAVTSARARVQDFLVTYNEAT